MIIFENVFRQMLIDTNLTEKRVFLSRAPQKPSPPVKTPYMVYFHVGPEPIHVMEGLLTPLIRVYQVSIFDPSQSRAIAIADTLRDMLVYWRGVYQDALIHGIFYENETSAYEIDTEIHQKIIEFRIIYRWLNLQPAKFHPSSINRSTQRSEWSNEPCPPRDSRFLRSSPSPASISRPAGPPDRSSSRRPSNLPPSQESAPIRSSSSNLLPDSSTKPPTSP